MQFAMKMDNKQLLDNKSKFVTVHSSSGFKHSLKGPFVTCILLLFTHEKHPFYYLNRNQTLKSSISNCLGKSLEEFAIWTTIQSTYKVSFLDTENLISHLNLYTDNLNRTYSYIIHIQLFSFFCRSAAGPVIRSATTVQNSIILYTLNPSIIHMHVYILLINNVHVSLLFCRSAPGPVLRRATAGHQGLSGSAGARRLLSHATEWPQPGLLWVCGMVVPLLIIHIISLKLNKWKIYRMLRNGHNRAFYGYAIVDSWNQFDVAF